MRRFIKIDIRPRGRSTRRTIPAIVSGFLGTAGGVALLVLMIPLLGIILAVIVGAGLGMFLVGAGWWFLRGRKLMRKMEQDLADRAGATGTTDAPRKKIQVKVREDE